ncbi:MAG: 3-phosphoshikimate 1-carboxyvinyltransferase [Dehalococcoidia bacterium]|nr:3-phosphoshikimate 1-carboxyvinyltransferase [Dehalococcoidia bacterium]
MKRSVIAPTWLGGTLSPPGDKSISHRSAILNAMAKGEALVTNYSTGGDCESTLRCLRALGVPIRRMDQEGSLVIQGVGLDGFREPDNILNAGNSGTTMRLLSGLLAGQPFLSIVTGDGSLRSRPMDRIIKPLRLMGARIQGRDNDSKSPMVISGGGLRGIEYTLPVASAQLKSCITIAALFAEGETTLHQPAASRDHTELMLQQMGATLVQDGLTVKVEPGHRLNSLNVNVPADISSAAYWLVAGVCHPSARVTVTNVGINPTRAGIIDALLSMGARLTITNRRTEGGEEVGDITAESSDLTGTEVAGDLIPRLLDEAPVLALAACFAKGTTVFRDAQELRVKESDRIKTTVQELSRLGADIRETADGMVVRGTGRLKGAVGQSHGDHRLAMTLGVAGLLTQGETEIRGAAVASISYPGFWNDLDKLAGDG